jgi:5-(carboxyamino)imidazole ribonucleotide synthase
MLALAGYPLGHTFVFFDQAPGEAPANIGKTIIGSFSDEGALTNFARECDVITYEFENVPCEAARFLQSKVAVYPPPKALEVSQDRVTEKGYIQSLGIATPRFEAASTEQELANACIKLGMPCVAKTRRFGYDGKGQTRLSDTNDVKVTWRSLGEQPLIVEGFVPFSRELSVIGVRGIQGDIEIYPLVENEHRDGILHRSASPASDVPGALKQEALAIATKLLQSLSYVGALAIELFDVGGHLLVNEIAPRVHNSGHATIDGNITSQFENHIRAISGMPLGSVTPRSRAVMINLIGSIPSLSALAGLPNSKVHLYGKSPRAGRKLGHVTLLDPSPETESRAVSLASQGLNKE